MTLLSNEEKEQLSSMTKTSWWSVLKKVVNDAESSLALSIMNKYDLDKKEDREEVKLLKIYNEARTDFIKRIETGRALIYTPSDV